MTVSHVRLLHAAFEAMKDECDAKLPNETGGILVGRFCEDYAEVDVIIGPGPRATHSRGRFRRDGAFAKRELDRIYDQSEGSLDYVGEWHSHPWPVGPSPRDWRSMRWISKNQNFALRHPLLIIVQRTLSKSWNPVAYRWTGDSLLRLPIVQQAPPSAAK